MWQPKADPLFYIASHGSNCTDMITIDLSNDKQHAMSCPKSQSKYVVRGGGNALVEI